MANFFKKASGPTPQEMMARESAKRHAAHYLSTARMYLAEGNINMARAEAMEGLRIAKDAPGYLALADELSDFVAALPTTRRRQHQRRYLYANAA